jgi:hypothetical protein
MALAKTVNCYVTVSEADTYFEDRLDVAAWFDAPPEERAKALVTATARLDALNWTGYASSSAQPLAFPRIGEYLDPRLGRLVSFSANGFPDRVVKATYELAYHFLNNDGLMDQTGSVTNLALAGISLTEIRATPEIPSVVMRLVRPMLVNAGANSWWRAN